MSEQGAAQPGDLTYPAPSPSSLGSAILRTVAYADLFDYPLTVPEVHRYLAGVKAPLSAVREALENGLLSDQRLTCRQG